MPLTALKLPIDQTRPGWLTRATEEGAALLEAARLSAMAQEVRSGADEGALGRLQDYLHLEVTTGQAAGVCTRSAMAGGGQRRARFYAEPLPRGLATLWSARMPFELGDEPLLVDGVALLSDLQGHLACLSLDTRQPLWARAGLSKTVAVWRGVVTAFTREGRPLGLDLGTGRELWRGEQDEGLVSSCLVVDGRLYFIAPGLVGCHDVRTGERLWRTGLPNGPGPGAQIALLGKILVVGGAATHLLSLEGRVLAQRRSAPWDCAGTLACTKGRIFKTAREGNLWALQPEAERVLWAERWGQGRLRLAIGAHAVVVTTPEGNVAAFRVDNGAEIWQRNLGRSGATDAAPTLVGEQVLVTGGERLMALDQQTGVPLWHLPWAGKGQMFPAAPTGDGRLLLSDSSGALLCLGAHPAGGAEEKETK